MDPAFAEWSKQVVLFCHVTTQVPSDPYPNLLQEKGGRGFPHLAFLDAEGGILAVHQGPRTVEAFQNTAQVVQSYVELAKKAAGGDKGAKFELLTSEFNRSSVDKVKALALLQECGELSKDQQCTWAAAMANADVREGMRTVTQDKRTAVAAGKRFLEMKKAGRIPDGAIEMQNFWVLIMLHAEEEKDAAAYEEALNAVKARYGSAVRADVLQKCEATLSRLKGTQTP